MVAIGLAFSASVVLDNRARDARRPRLPEPGQYISDVNLTTAYGHAPFAEDNTHIRDKATITVTDQHYVHSTSANTFEYDLTPRGLVVSRWSSGLADLRPAKPWLTIPADPTPGRHWTESTLASESGKPEPAQIRVDGKVTGTGTHRALGRTWSVVIIRVRLHIDGDLEATNDSTVWYSPELGVVLRGTYQHTWTLQHVADRIAPHLRDQAVQRERGRYTLTEKHSTEPSA